MGVPTLFVLLVCQLLSEDTVTVTVKEKAEYVAPQLLLVPVRPYKDIQIMERLD